jgi:hypothetical protein
VLIPPYPREQATPPALWRGAVSGDGYGTVRLDDPASPYVVSVAAEQVGVRLRVIAVEVTVRPGSGATITASGMSRLPLAGLALAAAATQHPNDSHWRSLVQGKPPGCRSWPRSHWGVVAAVWRWAHETGRPGGPNGTVGEFWAVGPATVKRWMARIRRDGLL